MISCAAVWLARFDVVKYQHTIFHKQRVGGSPLACHWFISISADQNGAMQCKKHCTLGCGTVMQCVRPATVLTARQGFGHAGQRGLRRAGRQTGRQAGRKIGSLDWVLRIVRCAPPPASLPAGCLHSGPSLEEGHQGRPLDDQRLDYQGLLAIACNALASNRSHSSSHRGSPVLGGVPQATVRIKRGKQVCEARW